MVIFQTRNLEKEPAFQAASEMRCAQEDFSAGSKAAVL